MFTRYFFQSHPESISQTLITALVLLALFNSTVWAPAMEPRLTNEAVTDSQTSPSKTTTVDHSPNFGTLARSSSTDPSLRRVSTVVGHDPGAIYANNTAVAMDPTVTSSVPSAAKSAAEGVQSKGLKQPTITSINAGIRFIENMGQFDPKVKFQVKIGLQTVWLTSEGIVFDATRPAGAQKVAAVALPPSDSTNGEDALPPFALKHAKPEPRTIDRLVFSEDFVGASCCSKVEGKDPQPGSYNYFQSRDPKEWRTNVRSYAEVVYRDVWPGIDLRIYGSGSDVEQEFIVHPGGDLSHVQISYRGIDGLSIAKDGSLEVATAFGTLRETKPRMYQQMASTKAIVDGRYRLTSDRSYTFEVEAHNALYALVVDPTLLYSTFLGGSAGMTYTIIREEANGIAVDASGNAYVAGITASTDFPTTPGAFQVNPPSGSFITKLNATGSALVYSTYFGYDATISSIAVDAAGQAYITGTTSGTYYGHVFPTTPNAYWPTDNLHSCASSDFYVTALSSTGDSLVYSSCFNISGSAAFLAGYGYYPRAIAVDFSGRVYIAGGAGDGAPTTSNAYQPSFPGGASAYVAMFDTRGSGTSSLVYATFLGPASSGSSALAYGVAVDSFGKVYLTGRASYGFPVTPGAFQTTYPGPTDTGSSSSFVAKFDPTISGSQSLIYSTYLGGTGNAYAQAIAVDATGNSYVTGYTQGGFPVTPGAFQTSGGYGFVTKLNASGSKLIYSTYVNGVQSGNAIAVDSLGQAYIVGTTTTANLTVTTDALESTYSGGFYYSLDGFLTGLNSTGSGLVYSTYLGGRGDDAANTVAVDQTGDVYVAGWTTSSNFPITASAYQPVLNPNFGQPVCNGFGCTGADAFVTKFPLGGTFRVLQIAPTSGGNAGNFTATIFGSGLQAGVAVKLSGGGPDIVAAPVSIGPGALYLTATFNLQGAATGPRDVVVTNADKSVITLPQAFTIVSGGAPNIQISKTATPAVPGRYMTYVITVSNTGDVDSGTLPIVETLGPWFTFVSSNPVPSSMRQAPKPFPPGSEGNYNAFIEWDIPSLPAGRFLTIRYTVALDASFVVGQAVTGDACIETFHNIYCPASYAECLAAAVPTCVAGGPLLCITACGGCLLEHYLCEKLAGVICTKLESITRNSLDPNSLAGPTGVGAGQWISGQVPISYMVSFANESNAGAPAQQVIVTDPVNTNLDISTLTLTSIDIPGVSVPIPATFVPAVGRNEVTTNVDLRPAQNLLVNIDAKFDPITRVITWAFSSIDPATGQPPKDPSVGFLPPGAGGSLSFAVKPKQGLATGTQVADQATVVFDTNPPMNTLVWTNTLDNNAPVSRVAALPATESCSNFKVQWSGSDIGAGIQSYTVYASDNGAGFAPWLTNTSSTSSVFQGQGGHAYGFYSIAQDLVGNAEPAKASAEATTTVTSGGSCGPPSLSGSASVVSYINTTLSLNLQFTNTGTSDALNTMTNKLTFRTLSGTGSVTLASPQLPIIVGTVSVDGNITIPLTLNVPATVKRFSMTEGGTMQDSSHNTYNFSLQQAVVP